MKNTIQIVDAASNLMGQGETREDAVADAARSLDMTIEQVEAELSRCRQGYQGEDSLFLEIAK